MYRVSPYTPSSGKWNSRREGLSFLDSIHCFTHVLKCDSEDVNLTRYKYNKRYTVPTLEMCKSFIPDVCCDTAVFNEVSVHFLATSANEIEKYTKYIPGENSKNCLVDSVAHNVGWDGAAHPVVLVIPTHQKTTILRNLPRLSKAVVVLFSNSDQACLHTSKGDSGLLEQVITAETTQETFVKDLDCALERYLFSFLKQFADYLIGGARTQFIKNPEKLSRLRDLRTEIQTLFERSDVPRSEFPTEYKQAGLSLSDEQKRKLFTKLNDISTVVGFGFRYHVLQINVDETAPDRKKITQALEELMNEFHICQYECNFVAKNIVHLKKCGEEIYRIRGQCVTLGCFAFSPHHLYALTCKHFTPETDECPVYTKETNTLLGHLYAFSTEKDIAAIKIDPDLAKTCETALRDEDDRPLAMACPIWIEETFQLPLPVYIIGAKTKPGLGKVVSFEFYLPELPHILLIESMTDDNFCQPGDSGSIVIARPNHKCCFAMAMIMGEISGKSPKQYVAIMLKHSLPELEKVIGSRLEVKTFQ